MKQRSDLRFCFADTESDAEEVSAAGVAEAVQAASPQLPQAWLDVTIPVRFMVNSSALHLHPVHHCSFP